MQRVVNRAGWVLAAMISLLVLAAMAGVVRGGPLDPPGAPAPTLPQVEPRIPISSLPFTIAQPGSYYVTKDLTGVSGQHGITIAASHVTLDLDGFYLQGVPGSLDGVHANPGGFIGISITNGHVDGWGGAAIDVSNAGGEEISHVDAYSNGGAFALAGGAATILSDCNVFASGGGVTVGAQSMVSRCRVQGNGAAVGIAAGATSIVSDCIVDHFGTGVLLADTMRVSGCTVTNNALTGMQTANKDVIERSVFAGNNTSSSASGGGLVVSGTFNDVMDNTIRDGNPEILIASGADFNRIRRNSVCSLSAQTGSGTHNYAPYLGFAKAAAAETGSQVIEPDANIVQNAVTAENPC